MFVSCLNAWVLDGGAESIQNKTWKVAEPDAEWKIPSNSCCVNWQVLSFQVLEYRYKSCYFKQQEMETFFQVLLRFEQDLLRSGTSKSCSVYLQDL